MLRKRYNNPYVIVAGDFNKRDARRATADFPDIKPIQTPPTRGRNVLDVMLTSFNDAVLDSGVTDAIKCTDGIELDHKTVFAVMRMQRVPSYEIEQYEYYHVDQKGRDAFEDWASKETWHEVFSEKSPSAKVEALERSFERAMARCFTKKKRKKKTSEPPWMTQEIRQWIVRRRAIFKRYGRNSLWKKLKKRTKEAIKSEERGTQTTSSKSFLKTARMQDFTTVSSLL